MTRINPDNVPLLFAEAIERFIRSKQTLLLSL
jgi:hypothetical protein